jgi:YcxB-like protein
MQIDYQISEDDFVAAANLADRKRSVLSAIRYFKLHFFLALTLVLILIAVFVTHEYTIAYALLAWMILLLLLGRLRVSIYRRRIRKNPNSHLLRSLDIDGESLYFKTADSEGRAAWQAFSKVAEDDRVFVLFQRGDRLYIPIPKRELTPAQIPELRALFETHLPHK